MMPEVPSPETVLSQIMMDHPKLGPFNPEKHYPYYQATFKQLEALASNLLLTPSLALRLLQFADEIILWADRLHYNDFYVFLLKILVTVRTTHCCIRSILQYLSEKLEKDTCLSVEEGQRSLLKEMCLPTILEMCEYRNFTSVLTLCGHLYKQHSFELKLFNQLFQSGICILSTQSTQQETQMEQATSLLRAFFFSSLDTKSEITNDSLPSAFGQSSKESYSFLFLAHSVACIAKTNSVEYEPELNFIFQLIPSLPEYLNQNQRLLNNVLFKSLVEIYAREALPETTLSTILGLLEQLIRLQLTTESINHILKQFNLKGTRSVAANARQARVFQILDKCRTIYKNRKQVLTIKKYESFVRRKISEHPCVIQINVRLRQLLENSLLFTFQMNKESPKKILIKKYDSHPKVVVVGLHNSQEIQFSEYSFQNQSTMRCSFTIQLKKDRCEIIELFSQKRLLFEGTCRSFSVGSFTHREYCGVSHIERFKVFDRMTLKHVLITKEEQNCRNLIQPENQEKEGWGWGNSKKMLEEVDVEHKLLSSFDQLFRLELGQSSMFIILFHSLNHISKDEQLLKTAKMFSAFFEKCSIGGEAMLHFLICFTYRMLSPLSKKAHRFEPYLIFQLMDIFLLPATESKTDKIKLKLSFLCNFVMWKRQHYNFQTLVLKILENLLEQVPLNDRLQYVQDTLIQIIPMEANCPDKEAETTFYNSVTTFVTSYTLKLIDAKQIDSFILFLTFLTDFIKEQIRFIKVMQKKKDTNSEAWVVKTSRSFFMDTRSLDEGMDRKRKGYDFLLSLLEVIVSKKEVGKILSNSNPEKLVSLISFLEEVINSLYLNPKKEIPFKKDFGKKETKKEGSIKESINIGVQLFNSYLNPLKLYFTLFALIKAYRRDYFGMIFSAKRLKLTDYNHAFWVFYRRQIAILKMSPSQEADLFALFCSTLAGEKSERRLEQHILLEIIKIYLSNHEIMKFEEAISEQIRSLGSEVMIRVVNELSKTSKPNETIYNKIAALLYRKQNIELRVISLLLPTSYRLYFPLYYLIYFRNLATFFFEVPILERHAPEAKKFQDTLKNLSKDQVVQFCNFLKGYLKAEKQSPSLFEEISNLEAQIMMKSGSHCRALTEQSMVCLLDDSFVIKTLKLLEQKVYHQLENFMPKTTSTFIKLSFLQWPTKQKITEWEEIITKGKKKIQMLNEAITRRSEAITIINKTWATLEIKNPEFWESFLKEEREFILSEFAGDLKQHVFICKRRARQNIELPQNKKQSVEEAERIPVELIAVDQYTRPRKASVYENKKQQDATSYNVLYVTNCKIYQGVLRCKKKTIHFIENTEVDPTIYEEIGASFPERRTELQILKSLTFFKIYLNSNQKMIMPKKYLYEPLAVEITADNRTYFFRFESREEYNRFRRQKSSYYHKQFQVNAFESGWQMTRKWQQGRISNFEYLMKINDFSGRSFNDLSQYYIFPWTVINFSSPSLDKQFFKLGNFRNLKLPIGKCNSVRFQQFEQRYKDARNHQLKQAYYYGIYISNPAVVCNYLVRIAPFSTHHFVLQSKKFDEADRLFHSIQGSWLSTYINYSDLRELIPEFYFFSEFLRNRSDYNLGLRREGGGLVNHVILPTWVRTNTPEEFICKMRRCLESKIVTDDLHNWIDNVFGIYSPKEAAQKHDNLYTSHVYEKSSKQGSENEDFERSYYKEFGQLPNCLFVRNHPRNHAAEYVESKNMRSKSEEDIKSNISHYTFEECEMLDKSVLRKEFQLFDRAEKILQKLDNNLQRTRIKFFQDGGILVVNKVVFIYDLEGYDKERVRKITNFEPVESVYAAQFIGQSDSEMLFVAKEADRVCFYTSIKSVFLGKEIEKEKKHFIEVPPSSKLYNIHQHLIIVFQQKLRVYVNDSNCIQEQKMTKFRFLFREIDFNLHTNLITETAVCEKLSLILTIDSSHQTYLLRLQKRKLIVMSSFVAQGLYLKQTIIQSHIHPLNMLLFLCRNNRILVYNFFGEVLVDTIVSFKKNSQNTKEIVTCLEIFNEENSEIILGTNFGGLYKIDIFDDLAPVRDRTKTKSLGHQIHFTDLNPKNHIRTSSKSQIIEMKVNRKGRHYEMLILNENGKVTHLASPCFKTAQQLDITSRAEDD